MKVETKLKKLSIADLNTLGQVAKSKKNIPYWNIALKHITKEYNQRIQYIFGKFPEPIEKDKP